MTPEAAASMPFVPRTKLRPPRLSQDLLRRPRLIEKLDRPQTLSLVIAPAGYGKTTLIGTWLAQCGIPCAWLSLEREDDTLWGFLTGLTAALGRLAPTLAGELARLPQPQIRELDKQQELEQVQNQIMPILLNTLDTLEERFVVVLDDYHHVHDAAIHQLICGLLEHPPRALQLVLTTRYDPPLPPRLRYRGNVAEIRARELSFTEQEAQEFLRQFSAAPLAAQAVAGLVKEAEGWAVPLRLAATLISQRQDAAVIGKALQICERSLLDYLDAEVIGHLPPAVQAFLVRTSILSRLHAGVCDAVLGEEQAAVDSKATLCLLADSGIFVEQLDGAADWFRYHELFRCLLQRRLRNTHGVEEIDAFTQRARMWQQQHDRCDQVVNVQSDMLVRREMATVISRDDAGSGTLAAPRVGQHAARDEFDAKWAVAQVVAESQALRRAQTLPTAEQNARVLLTYREMDVLALLCERLTNKEIAYKLGVSPETVRQHTVNLYRKLRVAGRRQAIVQAQALGLMAPPVDAQAVLPAPGLSRRAPTGMGR